MRRFWPMTGVGGRVPVDSTGRPRRWRVGIPITLLRVAIMGDKFIPSADLAFAQKAGGFADAVAGDPGRFGLSREQADSLRAAVTRFQELVFACQSPQGRLRSTTMQKNEARAAAERAVRGIANVVRANEAIDAVTKQLLGIRARPARLKVTTCPQEPPQLTFARALHEGGPSTPLHELTFSAIAWKRGSKPDGAVRMELFVDLVLPEQPIPAHPGDNLGGRLWYLRSYTRSPIRLVPPTTRVPMRVVYWGRWADSTGNVGPFSKTAVGWVEGGNAMMLPGGGGPRLGSGPHMQPVEALPAPATSGGRYAVALLEVHYQTAQPAALPPAQPPALPATPTVPPSRQLEHDDAEAA
jgi:hypothetical protein